MHRKFLKLKVMAAISSAAFLLGTVDAGAVFTYKLTTTPETIIDTIKEWNPDDSYVISVSDSCITFAENMAFQILFPTKNNENVVWNLNRDLKKFGGTEKRDIIYVTDRSGLKTTQTILGIQAKNIIVDTSGTNDIGGGLLVYHNANNSSFIEAANISAPTRWVCGNLGAIYDWTPVGIIAADNIKVSGQINALNVVAEDGVIAAKNIIAAGEVEAKQITVKNKVKTNDLYCAIINASSLSTTRDLTLTSDTNGKKGIFTKTYFGDGITMTWDTFAIGNSKLFSVAGTSKLNGGASLNSKKITNIAKGTINAGSTDAINGTQLYNVKKQVSGIRTYSISNDLSKSDANALFVNKSGIVDFNDTGILTGNAVYNITNIAETTLKRTTSSLDKNRKSIASMEDTMGDLKKSVASINSTVTSTTKNMTSSLFKNLQSDLGNLSEDGKGVIKNLITETLRSMNIYSAAVASNNEIAISPVSISSVSIMSATVDAIEIANPNVAKVNTTDVNSVYDVLDTKVGKTDFEALRTGMDSNATTIATNTENIKTNTSAIDTLKTSKANTDGSNLNLGAYSAKLGTGEIEKDNAGLVTGGTVYGTLDQKADASYVEAGLGVMSKQLDSVKQTATRDMNRMGANAAALASLHPQDYDPADKLDFSAGYGHYHNSNATAVGAFYRPNASTMVSLAGTVGNGDSMVSAGLSFKLGMNANVEKVMISKDDFDKQQVVNHQMKWHLDNQTARLERMEAAIAAMISH